MERSLVCYDVETSGLSPVHDRIVQLSAVKVTTTIEYRNWYIKLPQGVHISESVIAVHHITEEFLEQNGEDPIKVAKEFYEFIKGCNLLTYNGNRFDIQFVDRLLKDAGFDIMDEPRQHYDAFQMDVRLNPRDLSHTYTRYTGREMVDAHDARADVNATVEIFAAMMSNLQFDEIDTWPENNMLTVDGSIRNAAGPGEDPILLFTRGKYKDCEFGDICKRDIKYVQWFKDNVASPSTWKMLTKYYNDYVRSRN